MITLVQAHSLSRDHKPDLEIERDRILKAGGFIHAGRVNGSLNLARAIGMWISTWQISFSDLALEQSFFLIGDCKFLEYYLFHVQYLGWSTIILFTFSATFL